MVCQLLTQKNQSTINKITDIGNLGFHTTPRKIVKTNSHQICVFWIQQNAAKIELTKPASLPCFNIRSIFSPVYAKFSVASDPGMPKSSDAEIRLFCASRFFCNCTSMENGASVGAVFISFAKLHCYKFESVWPMKDDVNQEIRAQTGRNSLQNLRGKQQVRPIWEKRGTIPKICRSI